MSKCDHVVIERLIFKTNIWDPITLSELIMMPNPQALIYNDKNGKNLLESCPKCGEKIDWDEIKKIIPRPEIKW